MTGSGVTLSDVALRAGVSASTASRALNGTAAIADVTVERVRSAASELGYAPHRGARHLAGGRIGAVAVLVPDLTNPFFSTIARGAQRSAQLAGELTLIADSEDRPSNEVDLITRLVPDVDGVILCSPVASTAALREALAGRPAVTVNRRTRSLCSVVADQAGAVRIAHEHLKELGHDRIAYIRGPADKWVSSARDQVAASVGLELLGPVTPTFAGGIDAAQMLDDATSAVIAHNDLVAIGLMDTLLRRGRRVPGDLSVVGCDDVDMASLVRPTLTSIHMPLDDLGRTAMDTLLELIEGSRGPEAPRHVVLPVSLAERDSTGPQP